jgi:hypothetical protein
MLSSPLMTEQDKQQRLWGQLRAGHLVKRLQPHKLWA